MRSLGLLLVLAVCAAGCVRRGHERFREYAFYPYRALYRVESGGAPILPAPWVLENFARERDGSIGAERTQGEFTHRVQLDLNGDGEFESYLDEPIFDLRFRHGPTGGTLFSRTVPLSPRARQRDLQVLAHEYVDRTSGGVYFAVDWAATTHVEERRFAPRVLWEGPASVDGRPAYVIRFELVDVDRHRVAPESHGLVIELVWIDLDVPWHVGMRGARYTFRAVALVGVAAEYERFEQVRGALATVLQQITVRGPSEALADFYEAPRRAGGASIYGATSGGEAPRRSPPTEPVAPVASAPVVASAPASRLQPGDWVAYRHGGPGLAQVITLQEEIVARDGLRLEIMVTMTRGDEVRRFVQVVTDTAEARAANRVDELFVIDGRARRRVDVSELGRLYEWVLLPLEGGPDATMSSAERVIAGERYTCQIRSGARTLAGRAVTFDESECPDFAWTHGPMVVRDASSGETLVQVEVTGAGGRR